MSKQIALQFADEQLHDAVAVYRALRARLPKEKELYVLADTTYGRCVAPKAARGRFSTSRPSLLVRWRSTAAALMK